MLNIEKVLTVINPKMTDGSDEATCTFLLHYFSEKGMFFSNFAMFN